MLRLMLMEKLFKSKKLAKGRGEDARQAHSLLRASQFSERDFPTGQMTDAGGFFGYPEAETWTDGISHIGVFGEKRHILVESSRANPPRHDQTHINWVHIRILTLSTCVPT
jgi:hypothetical protein